jgi:hypothetical protein
MLRARLSSTKLPTLHLGDNGGINLPFDLPQNAIYFEPGLNLSPGFFAFVERLATCHNLGAKR